MREKPLTPERPGCYGYRGPLVHVVGAALHKGELPFKSCLPTTNQKSLIHTRLHQFYNNKSTSKKERSFNFNMSDLEEIQTSTSTSRLEDFEKSTPDGEPVSEKKPTPVNPSNIQAPVSALKLYVLFPAVCFSTFLFSLNASIVATVSAHF
jgi:hypothetical protein